MDSLEEDAAAREAYDALEDADYDEGEDGESPPLKQQVTSLLDRSFRLKRRDEGPATFRYKFRDDILSVLDFHRWFGAGLEPLDSRRTKPFTFCRDTAVSTGAPLARVGHPIVDGLWDFTRHDDRGIAFAMLRIRPAIGLTKHPRLAFRFDYYVEADTSAAEAVADRHRTATNEAVRRRADVAFPPRFKTVWVDEALQVIADERVLMHLETPYEDDGLHHAGFDVNIRHHHWEVLDRLLEIADWSRLCRDAQAVSIAHFEEHLGLDRYAELCVAELQRKHQAVAAQLESRLAYTPDGSVADEQATLDLECELLDALTQGIQSPHVRLDAVGAIVTLADNPLSEEV